MANVIETKMVTGKYSAGIASEYLGGVANVSRSQRRLVKMVPFDWEDRKAKYGKKEQPYEIGDAWPRYNNLARFVGGVQTGTTSKVRPVQSGPNLAGYKSDAVKAYSTLFQDYRSN